MHGSPRILAVLLSAWALTLPACSEEGLSGPKAEVKETTIKLDLPAVPQFDTPSAHPDGTHSVREMRLKGRKLFESDLKIKGYITWIYDCAAEVRKPEMTDKQVAKLLEEQPDMCNRPHFFIGDTKDTPPEKSVWVVEVPRALRKDELKTYTKEEIRAMPRVPGFDIGDEVIVHGTWDQKSPKGFFNSDGLLAYKEMENLSRSSGEGE
jgi:hypothetical protein